MACIPLHAPSLCEGGFDMLDMDASLNGVPSSALGRTLAVARVCFEEPPSFRFVKDTPAKLAFLEESRISMYFLGATGVLNGALLPCFW